MSIETVMASNHLVLCHPLLLLPSIFPSIRVFFFFPVNQLFISGSQSIGALASVLPMNIQSWFPLGLTGLISLLSKVLSRVLSSTTIWKHQFFGAQPSLWSSAHICTWLLKNHCFDYMDLCCINFIVVILCLECVNEWSIWIEAGSHKSLLI